MFEDVEYTDLIPRAEQALRRARAASAISILNSEDEAVPLEDIKKIISYIKGETNLDGQQFPAAAMIRLIGWNSCG